MKLIEKFKQKKPVVSFEIFPPKTEAQHIFPTLEAFAKLSPDFISVTYGAGGTSKGTTLQVVSHLKNVLGIEPLCHLTSVGHSLEEVDGLIYQLQQENIENILALRGDPPKDRPDFDFRKNVFQYAADFISHLKKQTDACICGAAYPEGHSSAKSLREDLAHLKDKVDRGVDFLVTQLFFDNRIYFNFLERARQIGIECPLNPAVMPILKADQIKRIAFLCGASMPAKVIMMLDKYGDREEEMIKAGLEYASEQIRDLLQNGVEGVHILALNHVDVCGKLLEQSGLKK